MRLSNCMDMNIAKHYHVILYNVVIQTANPGVYT